MPSMASMTSSCRSGAIAGLSRSPSSILKTSLRTVSSESLLASLANSADLSAFSFSATATLLAARALLLAISKRFASKTASASFDAIQSTETARMTITAAASATSAATSRARPGLRRVQR